MPFSSSRAFVALLAATAFATFLVACPPTARAGEYPQGADTAGGGVARLSFMQGPVAVQRGDSGDQNDAVINAPVMGADYVTTGEGARAEIQFDAASMVRLGSEVQLRLTRLDPNRRTIQLAAGTIEVRMLRRYEGDAEIDTPSVGVRPREAGSYRITVTPDGRTLVTVRSGAVDVLSPQDDQPLLPGATLVAQGAAANPSIRAIAEMAPDEFDRFNQDRDRRAEIALEQTASYVSTSVPGVDDLDRYGQWVDDPSYGEVWAPANVAAGWAPYRDGSWTWEDGYGWTWVGYEPWGWAPYHYGRWFHSARYGWCWYPPRGPFIAEPWSPALVAFIGFGSPGFALGIGFGNVGWVPLGPAEPFHPWWGRRRIENVTIENVNVVYRNARYGGVTAVPGRRFMAGRFDHPIAVRTDQLGAVHAVRGMLPVVPTTANLRFSDRPAPRRLAPGAPLVERSFAGTGVVVRRTPFEQQRTAVAADAHLTAPRVPVAGPWQRFDATGGGVRSAPGPAYAAPNRGYSAPARTYSQPTRTYDAPSRSNGAPMRSYGAPPPAHPAPQQAPRQEPARPEPARPAPAPAARPAPPHAHGDHAHR